MEEAVSLFFVVPDSFRTGTSVYHDKEDRFQLQIKRDCPTVSWKSLGLGSLSLRVLSGGGNMKVQ